MFARGFLPDGKYPMPQGGSCCREVHLKFEASFHERLEDVVPVLYEMFPSGS